MNALRTDEARPPLWRLVWEHVRQDRIPLRASALSFQTLVSLVPVLAIVLAVLSGPTFQSQREHVVAKFTALLTPGGDAKGGTAAPSGDEDAENSEAGERVRDKMQALVHETVAGMDRNLGKISVFSFAILLVIAYMLFRTVEETFNAIWKVRTGRSIFTRLAITSAFLLWGPVMVLLSIALTEYVSSWPVLGGYVVPVVLTAVAFTGFYMIMPHVQVRITSALAGGIVGALLWELSKIGFLVYVSHAVTISKLYGSLGIVPVLFGWIYLSWMVVLAGAELTYILQHHRAIVEQWEHQHRDRRALLNLEDVAAREAALLPHLALAAALEVAERFRAGTDPGGVRRSVLAEALGTEAGTTARALERLVQGGLLARVSGEGKESDGDPRFLPARDLQACSLALFADAARGGAPLERTGPSWAKAREIIERLDREGRGALVGLTLADLAKEAKAAAKAAAPAATPPKPDAPPPDGAASAAQPAK
ncbi:MAG: YihY family inner membrane protein [Planctomycetes bacterium]|nr:YihY family inner membrane protein [Planctomycetota bacterium]